MKNTASRPISSSRAIASLCLLAAAGCSQDLGTTIIEAPDLLSGPGTVITAAPDAASPCPDGYHLLGGTCMPNEVTCAAEFPCPDGQLCVGGRCVDVTGPCTTNDDCPTGYSCNQGTCEPVCPSGQATCHQDSDCASGYLCLACACESASLCATPAPDLSGTPWQAMQDLHLDQALGSFGQSFAGLMKDLRDGIDNCPPGSDATCPLFQIIAGFLPSYVKVIIVVFGDFADFLDNKDFRIQSVMTFTKNGKPQGWSGVDNWTLVTFEYQNMVVSAAPQNVPEIGHAISVPFDASMICGVIYVDKHDIDGVLGGILLWILDDIVEFETCSQGGLTPCYHTLSDAIDGAIDCSVIPAGPAQQACVNFRNGIAQKIDSLIEGFLGNYALMTLQGTAVEQPTGHQITGGKWYGTLGDGIALFQDFTGEWSATR